MNRMSALFAAMCCASATFAQTPTTVLVFSKTAAYRHASIETGIETLKQLGAAHGIHVEATEDASAFTQDNLSRYAAVVFLSTTGDVLDTQQEQAFERYIRNGHGFVGIHGAADTEYDWPWYGKLVGARFDGHDEIQSATLVPPAPFGDALPSELWVLRDEWYNFRDIAPDITVVLKLDTKTFKGSKHDGDHPIAWYREFDGGRMFYTGLGHTPETYADPTFRAHLLVGLRYAIGTEVTYELR